MRILLQQVNEQADEPARSAASRQTAKFNK